MYSLNPVIKSFTLPILNVIFLLVKILFDGGSYDFFRIMVVDQQCGHVASKECETQNCFALTCEAVYMYKFQLQRIVLN